MNLNWITCKIKIDKVNYLKDRTVGKNCYNKKRRKKSPMKKKRVLHTVNQKVMSTITLATTQVFQHMKTTAMFLLAQAFLVGFDTF